MDWRGVEVQFTEWKRNGNVMRVEWKAMEMESTLHSCPSASVFELPNSLSSRRYVQLVVQYANTEQSLLSSVIVLVCEVAKFFFFYHPNECRLNTKTSIAAALGINIRFQLLVSVFTEWRSTCMAMIHIH